MVRKYNVSNVYNSKNIIRDILKEINYESEITMFDMLDGKETDEIIDRIFNDIITLYANKEN